ncbi:phage integrase SAM-like domain-containing protein [Psychrosphaera aestuarii]|uniref:phage integrase SAM-like domain-containing protein n=1 Tax=Psychrosphaera aestuarii TaxID=1266052 RepID=UPI001B33CE71|nr:phage integrase SAM-like domain-containing protein [Psychrosphaera aestuarii]
MTTQIQRHDIVDGFYVYLQNQLDLKAGKVSYKDYIQALDKYHIPYFGKLFVTSIDQDKIRLFDKWRFEQNGRQLSKSTLMTHNVALQMVFKEAIDRKWMIVAQVPVLTSKGGEVGTRRAAFTGAI